MTPEFIAALTDELADYFGPEITDRAHASFDQNADSDAYAETIARFFEQAVWQSEMTSSVTQQQPTSP